MVAAYLPFEFISLLSGVLIASVITVFTFAVTLLGKAIQLVKEEETRLQTERTQGFQERISDLSNRLEEAKTNGDSRVLENELTKLTQERKIYEKSISLIKNKYSYLSFDGAVFHTILFFILSLLLAQIGAKLQSVNTIDIYAPYLFIIATIALISGMHRLRKSLLVIQEISSKSNGEEHVFDAEKMARAIKTAMAEHEADILKETGEKLTLNFTNQTPFTCKVSEEYELNFKVSLSQGKVIKAVTVWFFVPDAITLMQPSERQSWRQDPTYGLPNIKTVKVPIGQISIGPTTSSKIKIKAPEIPGTYPLYYRLYAEGYQENRQEIQIVVT